jgi:hypothetical protein
MQLEVNLAHQVDPGFLNPTLSGTYFIDYSHLGANFARHLEIVIFTWANESFASSEFSGRS